MAKAKGVGRGKNTKNQAIAIDPSKRGRDKTKLNRLQKEELVTQIIEWIGEGESKPNVKELILTHSPVKLNDNDATALIRFACQRMEEITKQDAATVIGIHVERYEQIYKYFASIDQSAGYLKALKAKEKLLGLFKDKKKLVINQKKKVVIERKVEYDMSKLNPEEQKRLTELFNKAK